MRRLASQHAGHLGHLLTPTNGNRVASLLSTGLRWAADNSCYAGLDEVAFMRMLVAIQNAPRPPLWVACPDVVGDAKATLRRWAIWSGTIREYGLPVAYVLQDGQESLPLPRADAYFIGGTTEFKLSAVAADLAAEAKRCGAWLHMGRVNSRRRFEIAHAFACDSIDGTSASMFSETHIPRYLRWLHAIEAQPSLF